jgi:hypothetical protein
MRHLGQNRLNSRTLFSWLACFAGFVAIAAFLVSCGGSGGTQGSNPGIASITVNLSDPPSCAFPNGNFDHVFVTIRSVQAHTSATANDNSSGWQELAPQLNTQPMQIDLFALAPNACLLVTLGSNTALPAGTYQQIRLLLVANSGASGPLPITNACAGQGFNCIVLHDGSVHQLDLSSQANTGLKIPPGQIVGGPISVGAKQDIDLNIDFNACASIVQEGNGQYRLKPVLTAGQVSTNNTGISGRVIDAVSGAPVPVGATGAVLVALEQQDATGADVIFRETVADSSGNFNFCPLPAGATFDVVAVAIDGNGAGYNATIAASVPGGTNIGIIPLNIETGASNKPTIFQGVVTASGSASIDAAVSALQTVPFSGIEPRAVTIPAEGNSVSNVPVVSSTLCPAGAPAKANCATYTLVEPASNPRFGVFTAGAITYSTPAPGDVPYTIRADAFTPLSGGTPSCSPSSKTINVDTSNNGLKAVGGTTVPVKEMDFAGCS